VTVVNFGFKWVSFR